MLQHLATRLRTWFLTHDIAYRLDGTDPRILADMGIPSDDIAGFARRAATPVTDAGRTATLEALPSRRSCDEACGVPA